MSLLHGNVGGKGYEPATLKSRLSQALFSFTSELGNKSGALAQVWCPEICADGSCVLTSQGLPFAVAGVGDLLALFRCVSVRYRFSTDVLQPALMGAIGRVYASLEPEMSNNVQRYDKQVYLRVSEAQRCRVHSTLVAPIFADSSREKPVAVFELVQGDKDVAFPALQDWLHNCLQSVGLCTADFDFTASAPGLRKWPANAMDFGLGPIDIPPPSRARRLDPRVDPIPSSCEEFSDVDPTEQTVRPSSSLSRRYGSNDGGGGAASMLLGSSDGAARELLRSRQREAAGLLPEGSNGLPNHLRSAGISMPSSSWAQHVDQRSLPPGSGGGSGSSGHNGPLAQSLSGMKRHDSSQRLSVDVQQQQALSAMPSRSVAASQQGRGLGQQSMASPTNQSSGEPGLHVILQQHQAKLLAQQKAAAQVFADAQQQQQVQQVQQQQVQQQQQAQAMKQSHAAQQQQLQQMIERATQLQAAAQASLAQLAEQQREQHNLPALQQQLQQQIQQLQQIQQWQTLPATAAAAQPSVSVPAPPNQAQQLLAWISANGGLSNVGPLISALPVAQQQLLAQQLAQQAGSQGQHTQLVAAAAAALAAQQQQQQQPKTSLHLQLQQALAQAQGQTSFPQAPGVTGRGMASSSAQPAKQPSMPVLPVVAPVGATNLPNVGPHLQRSTGHASPCNSGADGNAACSAAAAGAQSNSHGHSGPLQQQQRQQREEEAAAQDLLQAQGAMHAAGRGSARAANAGDDDDFSSNGEEEGSDDDGEGRAGRGRNNRIAGGAGKRLRYEDLQSQFGTGLKEAAHNLGICATTLKRACRRHNIKRWPRRQIIKLNKSLKEMTGGVGADDPAAAAAVTATALQGAAAPDPKALAAALATATAAAGAGAGAVSSRLAQHGSGGSGGSAGRQQQQQPNSAPAQNRASYAGFSPADVAPGYGGAAHQHSASRATAPQLSVPMPNGLPSVSPNSNFSSHPLYDGWGLHPHTHVSSGDIAHSEAGRSNSAGCGGGGGGSYGHDTSLSQLLQMDQNHRHLVAQQDGSGGTGSGAQPSSSADLPRQQGKTTSALNLGEGLTLPSDFIDSIDDAVMAGMGEDGAGSAGHNDTSVLSQLDALHDAFKNGGSGLDLFELLSDDLPMLQD